MPFEVPAGWCWCKLCDIAYFGGGKTPSMACKGYWANGKNLWVTSKDMKYETITDSLMKITDAALVDMQVYTPGTLLMVTRSGILKRTLPLAILEKAATVNQDLKTISIVSPCIPEYVFYMIRANEAFILKEYHKDGTTVDSINFDKFVNLLLPLPPVEEQKRIISEIKKWMHHVASIESSQSEFFKTLQAIKSKILDLAISGKLVPQDPADEPAIDLLKRINPSFRPCDNPHYPFEIPSSWVFASGKDIFLSMKSVKPTGEEFCYIDIDSVDNKNNTITSPKIIKTESAPSRASRFTKNGDVIFSMVRPYLRNIAMVRYDNCIASTGFYVCSPTQSLCSDYLFLMMLSDYVVDGLNQYMKGDNSPSINTNNILSWKYPVPPLNEQKRIVIEVQRLYTYLNKVVSLIIS